MELKIDWREPPLTGEARLQAALKHHAGRWARVKKDMASKTASSAWRKLGFQTEVHPAESDATRFDIYARWPAADTNHMPAAAVPPPATAPKAPAPGTASKMKPVTTKDGVPVNDDDLKIPTSGDVTGGYLASRAARHIPADGTPSVRIAGPTASPVRP